MRNFIKAAAVAVTMGFGASASADVIVLDFEGVGNLAAINDFYNGGTDDQGNSGDDFGVGFSDTSLGIIDSDAGGTGNIANEPSGETVLFFLSGGAATMNVAGGFDTGFSFFYSASQAAFVNVYSGLNGTGDLLASINLAAQHNEGCVGDPNGTFCNWTDIGVAFAGIAMSVDFGGSADLVAFDNVTFGSITAGGDPVPLPAAFLLFPAGVAALRTMRRKA